jgi:PadR family transcriptional regulator PadR
MTTEGPLGSFEEQVLLAVIRTGRDGTAGAYGMAVRRELEEVTGRGVAIGAVYATLDRLEAKGLVTSARGETSAAEPRRLFAVSPQGARALAGSREMRDRLWRGVNLAQLLSRAVPSRGG